MGGNNKGPSTAAQKMGTSDNGTFELAVTGPRTLRFLLSPFPSFDQTAAGGDERRAWPPTSGGKSRSTGTQTQEGGKESSGPKTPSDTTFQSNRHKLAASSHKTQQGGRTDIDRRVFCFCLSTCCYIVFTIKRIQEGNAFSEQGS